MVKISTALDLKVSPVFVRNAQSRAKIVVNQGGTRSGKTYSILQVLLVYAFQNTGKIIDVVRKTKAEIRDTVLTDFIEILTNAGLYSGKIHNKTHDEFRINGNLIRFIGLDKAQKKRGAKRHILYVNECNGITLEDWIQLSVRTIEKIYLDFNPSEYFWLNEQVLEKRTDYELIKSTYLDNYDFLKPSRLSRSRTLLTSMIIIIRFTSWASSQSLRERFTKITSLSIRIFTTLSTTPKGFTGSTLVMRTRPRSSRLSSQEKRFTNASDITTAIRRTTISLSGCSKIISP
jgi:hypothetical protein